MYFEFGKWYSFMRENLKNIALYNQYMITSDRYVSILYVHYILIFIFTFVVLYKIIFNLKNRQE